MKKLAFFSVFMLLMLCAAHTNAQAQGVVTGITICEYDIPSNVVNGYSDTVADPVASLYYGVYTEGYLYRNLSLLQSGAAGPASEEAVVFTQDPNAVQDTQYDLVTGHYVVDIYYVPVDPVNVYGDDVLGYSLLPFAEAPNSYPFAASGPEVFTYDVLYYHIGNTRVTVGYFPPRLDTINPNWGYERGEVDVTLTGHNVDAGNFNTPVRVNVTGGITATVQSIDPTTLHARFQIPDNLTGQQQVTITSTHGTSNPLNFIASDRQPQITGISPSSIDAGTTTRVTIDGTDFGANPDIEIVGVTGAQYSIVSKSDTQVVVDIGVPVDSPSGDIIITVISRGANGAGFLPGPPNTSPRSNPEDVQVRRVRVVIKQDGTDITNKTRDIVVGQKVNLTAEVDSGGRAISNPKWTIPGNKIKNYVHDIENKGEVIGLTDQDLAQSSINFYWVDGGNSRQVSYSVTVNNQVYTGKATFNAKAPTNAMVSVTANGAIAVDSTKGPLQLHYGNASTPGIEFAFNDIDVTSLPNGVSYSIYWVQVVTSTLRRRQLTSDSSWQRIEATNLLDTQFPYDTNDSNTNDSPGVGLDSTYLRNSANDSFDMWLMFEPDGTDSIPIPLVKISWSWRGAATRDTATNTWSLDSDSAGKSNSPPASTMTFPTWSGNIANKNYVPEQ